ncbi:hypothetical protein BH24PSE2_BH24PSE2_21290 [soil metagenome]
MGSAHGVESPEPRRLHAIAVLLAGCVLATDLLLPSVAGVPLAYIFVLLAYANSDRPIWLGHALLGCAVLLAAGLLLNPAPQRLLSEIAYRVLVLLALLVTAHLLWMRMRYARKLRALGGDLEQAVARARNVMEQARDGILIVDAHGRILSINSAAERMLGYEPGELVDRSVVALLPEELHTRHDDFVGSFTRSREPRTTGAGREIEARRKDGTLCWVAVTVRETPAHGGRLFTAIVRDLSEQHSIAAAMHASETRFRVMFEQSPIGLVLCELDGRIRQANAAFLELSGYSQPEAMTLNFWDVVAGEEDGSDSTERSMRVSHLRSAHEKDLIRKDRESVPVLLNGVIVENSEGDARIWFTVQSHAELKQAQQKLVRLSLYDDLTGLANRKLFRDYLEKTLAHARREQRRLALLYLDLDGFKSVNDTLGHDAGDTLLKRVAHRLTVALRADDFIGRLGGDEFAVLIEDVDSADAAANVADKLIHTLGQAFYVNGHQLYVSTSVGIVIAPTNGADAGALARFADIAMYKAKDRGGSRYQFYSEAVHADVAQRAEMEVDLRNAGHKREFTLRYEPQLDLDTDRIVGFEALLYWQHPRRGLVPAGEFQGLLEKFGMIGSVGDWLLEQSCAELRRWLDQHDDGIGLAINVSAVQLADSFFADRTLATLKAFGIEPARLEVEVAERALIQDDKRVIGTLRELQENAVGIVIDGFGTGGSSLIHLKMLPPVRKLKVDRSFIADVPGNAGDRAIVTATIALAHGLGLKVTADGVETEWQKRFLKQAECDYAQGRHYSQPLDGDAAARLLNARAARQELEHII